MQSKENIMSASETLLALLLMYHDFEEGVSYLYDTIEAWAMLKNFQEVFSYVERMVDGERTTAGIEINPSREYIVNWPEYQLRGYLIKAWCHKLTTDWHKYPSPPITITDSDVFLDAKVSVGSMGRRFLDFPIDEAIAQFVKITISYAFLVNPEIVKKNALSMNRSTSNWTKADAYDYIYNWLFFSFMDSPYSYQKRRDRWMQK
jgi:hypothetical protein